MAQFLLKPVISKTVYKVSKSAPPKWWNDFSKRPRGTYGETISGIVPGQPYKVDFSVLRNDLGHHTEYVDWVKVDGQLLGDQMDFKRLGSSDVTFNVGAGGWLADKRWDPFYKGDDRLDTFNFIPQYYGHHCDPFWFENWIQKRISYGIDAGWSGMSTEASRDSACDFYEECYPGKIMTFDKTEIEVSYQLIGNSRQCDCDLTTFECWKKDTRSGMFLCADEDGVCSTCHGGQIFYGTKQGETDSINLWEKFEIYSNIDGGDQKCKHGATEVFKTDPAPGHRKSCWCGLPPYTVEYDVEYDFEPLEFKRHCPRGAPISCAETYYWKQVDSIACTELCDSNENCAGFEMMTQYVWDKGDTDHCMLYHSFDTYTKRPKAHGKNQVHIKRGAPIQAMARFTLSPVRNCQGDQCQTQTEEPAAIMVKDAGEERAQGSQPSEMAYYYSYYADQHGQPRTTTMQPNRDFWLHLGESDQDV